MLITNLISRYMKLCKAAFSAEDGAKLNKSIQTNVMEMLFLLMVIPRKCNFTQMGRYGKRGEQCYRQTAERSVNWLEMNMWLSAFATQSSSSALQIVRHATRENLTLPSTLHSRHSMWPKSCARNLARPSVDLKRRWSMPTMRNELLTCSRRTRTRH